eukprot:3042995-Amphidinium_carterae.1
MAGTSCKSHPKTCQIAHVTQDALQLQTLKMKVTGTGTVFFHKGTRHGASYRGSQLMASSSAFGVLTRRTRWLAR